MKFKKTSLFLGSLVVLGACSSGGSQDGSIVKALPDNAVIVEFEGGKVTAKDVASEVQADIKKFNDEAIQAYKQAAERVLMTKLLEAEAKKQGLKDPGELIAKVSGATTVGDEEVGDFIKKNKLEKGVQNPRTGKMEKVNKEDVRRYLESTKKRSQTESFIRGLMANAKVKQVLQEPKEVIPEDAHAPYLGAAKSKVVIQEFSDFQCPYCAGAHDTVKQLNAAYGDKIKIIFRQFPLESIHPEARPASIAALCAGQQKKFWPMHDKLFENQQTLNTESYKAHAKEIGLDTAAFEICIKDEKGEMSKLVDADMNLAQKIGVNSTPTFFVNGKKVAGAMGFEQFKTMIDQELGN